MPSTSPLKIHGAWASQPCRAVVWLCEMNSIPYEMIRMNPAWPRKDPRKQKFMAELNPLGRVPTLEDTESDVVLFESGAILTYIATKYNLQNLYPNGANSESDLKRRALIDQMLHWHHENVRLVTLGYIAPLLRADVPLDNWMKAAPELIRRRKMLNVSLRVVDTRYLAKHKFLVDDDVSVADLLCYEELYQLKKWDTMYPYSSFAEKFPNIDAWMQRMEKLPGHEKIHKIMDKLSQFLAKRVVDTEPLQKLIASKL